MKHVFSLFTVLSMSIVILYAQVPQAFNYTGIAKTKDGKEFIDRKISVKAVIRTDTKDGPAVYKEVHFDVKTNDMGMFGIKVGEGTPTLGAFDLIDWPGSLKFLKIAIGPNNGSKYHNMGSVQLVSVPFALYAQDEDADPLNEIQDLLLTGDLLTITENGTPTQIDLSTYLDNTDNQDLASVLTQGASAGDVNISDLADPLNNQDAATKAYVDVLQQQVTTLEDRIIAIEQVNDIEPVSDIDGNTYSVVKIGNQIWMAENLKTTKFNNGSDIPLITDDDEWKHLTTAGYCWYDNDQSTYGNTYGALYNWYTVNKEKLCPTGWHVPRDGEWDTLIDYLGGVNIAGDKLKEAGNSHWLFHNTGATNESGFTALPSGYRKHSGEFRDFSLETKMWSSLESDLYESWSRTLEGNYSRVSRWDYGKQSGLSVRCVKD